MSDKLNEDEFSEERYIELNEIVHDLMLKLIHTLTCRFVEEDISMNDIFYINSMVLPQLIVRTVYSMFEPNSSSLKEIFPYIDSICDYSKNKLEEILNKIN